MQNSLYEQPLPKPVKLRLIWDKVVTRTRDDPLLVAAILIQIPELAITADQGELIERAGQDKLIIEGVATALVLLGDKDNLTKFINARVTDKERKFRNQALIIISVIRDKLDIFKWLVEDKGLSLDARHSYSSTDQRLRVPKQSYHDCEFQKLELGEELTWPVDDKALELDMNNTGMSHTPVSAAAYNGRLEILKWLDGKGYPLYRENQFGDSPVLFAAEGGDLKVLKWLVKEKRLSLNVESDRYNNIDPASLAAFKGHLNILRWLLEEDKSLELSTINFRKVLLGGPPQTIVYCFRHLLNKYFDNNHLAEAITWAKELFDDYKDWEIIDILKDEFFAMSANVIKQASSANLKNEDLEILWQFYVDQQAPKHRVKHLIPNLIEMERYQEARELCEEIIKVSDRILLLLSINENNKANKITRQSGIDAETRNLARLQLGEMIFIGKLDETSNPKPS